MSQNDAPIEVNGIDEVEYLASLKHVRMKGYDTATQRTVYIWLTISQFQDLQINKFYDIEHQIDADELT